MKYTLTRKRKYVWCGLIVFICLIGIVLFFVHNQFNDGDEPAPAPAVPVTSEDISNQPHDASALGEYNVLIADRGNNRIIEVTPDKKIIWEYDFKDLTPGYGADDAFFTDNGKIVSVNLENYNLIEQIDYQTKQVIWQYGIGGKHGSTGQLLNSPDDAYKLPNGDVIVADIKNCRVIEISPEKQIVRQYGKTKQCDYHSGFLDHPNGDTPLPDGHILISNITGHNIFELDQNWKPIFSMSLPLNYPSDPQLTKAGNFLVAEYTNPGKIIEISRQRNIVWEYAGEGDVKMNKPSLAIELPNGNILSNDDLNHRVIVIDKNTKKIVWQYGVTGKPGSAPDQLNIPDGVDIINHSLLIQVPTSFATTTLNTKIYSVGQITRHSQNFIGSQVIMQGYLLKKEQNYIIFSDEAIGSISTFDLPVSGTGYDSIQSGHLYQIEGMFLGSGLISSNQNPNHLELSIPPIIIK
jgi:outer membrane protein assembly factor BamB